MTLRILAVGWLQKHLDIQPCGDKWSQRVSENFVLMHRAVSMLPQFLRRHLE